MQNILIVDDSPTEIYVLKTMLERHGYAVDTALNGEDGIRTARRNRPDLILMDVVMPGINGFQATRQLSKDPETADIPIVVVTTKDQEIDRMWALRQGARDFMVKPVRERDLIQCVRTLLE